MSIFPKTISGRLGLGYAAMAAFMAATIAMAWVELQSLGDLSRHLTRELASREREARQWQALLGRDALTANSMLVTSDPDKLKPLAAEMKARTGRGHAAFLGEGHNVPELPQFHPVRLPSVQQMKSICPRWSGGKN